ncbi:MFS transporter [Rhodopila sp.]|jgi:MFS family permease|uniref:MFS transporter n=1 Tax=Rhodopila sp. TaxID=2480087 RepID=UPI002BAE1A69|nr:MFS transporter [Rhodopila sp.]HVZ10764.1 MFS transporter [Rhodopila sp.]
MSPLPNIQAEAVTSHRPQARWDADHPARSEALGPPPPVPPWSPFRHAVFTVLWTAMVASSMGTWMQNAASGWLMTELSHDPLMIAMIQAAMALPVFLFGFPAGALADIVDRRRLLLVAQLLTTPVILGFAMLVSSGRATPATLLALTFVTGTSVALILPTWQAVLPQLVGDGELASAVALNSFGVSLSRVIGPAVIGVVIATFGMAAPFWMNAVSNVLMMMAVLLWRVERTGTSALPAEHIGRAMIAGLRHARYNQGLRAALIRGFGFFPFAAAYWALLPALSRTQIGGGFQGYGILLAAIGGGAVAGTFLLPWLRTRLGADRLVLAGTVGTAAAMALYAVAHDVPTALAASLLAGLCWIVVLATTNVAAQAAVPGWVRGRSLGVFAKVMFGSLTIGSVAWGQVASWIGSPETLLAAAAGLLLAIPLLSRSKLRIAEGMDFTPSMHWPAPVLAADVRQDSGPVQVMIEYRIRPGDREAFLDTLRKISAELLRNDVYHWEVYEDATDSGVFIETYHTSSWLDYLRQRERKTLLELQLRAKAMRFQIQGKPMVRHLVRVSKDGH